MSDEPPVTDPPHGTSVDSLLRAVARTPAVDEVPARTGPGSVIAGHFALLEELGRGGMGVVYRAHDRRLDREVAIKLMRAERWAHLPREALAERFAREARATARLRHPAIVTLHDAGEADGVFYLVLELLRGRSLAARPRRPLATALALAIVTPVVDAVAHAHAEGVVHRDLKPHNVLVNDAGQVWVLDFGLASLRAAEAEDPAAAALTRAGTPAYMAPEQRAGAPQDARTDVWALGLILYELVTGHEPPPLAGPDDLRRPPWTDDLARLPSSVARVIAGAVAWRAEDRYPTAAALQAALAAIDPDEPAPMRAAPARRRAWWLAGAAVVAAAGAAITLVAARGGARAPAPPPAAPRAPAPVQLTVDVPPTEPFATFQGPPVTVSSDGRAIVFVGAATSGTGAASQLYLRRLDEADATPLPGTEDAEGPVFSPDGAWLAYAKDGRLMKRPVAGGDAVALAPVHAGFRGASWLSDDALVMAPSWFSPLVVVPAGGGAPRPLTTLGPDEKSHRYPHALPGGRAVLFVVSDARRERFDDAAIEWVDVATGARRAVTTGGAPRFVPPRTLLVPRDGALWALPFDPATGAVTGPAARAVDGVITAPATGVGAFDLAGGTLAYFAGGPGLFDTEVVRVDRVGRATPLAVPARATTSVRALPAGRLLLRTDGANATLWLYDLPREIDTRLTWAWDADHAVLAPGGEHVYMVVTRGARAEIVRRRADGTGEDEPVWRGDAAPANLELSRDGRVLVFDAIDPATATADVMVLRFDTPGAPAAPYQATPEHETRPALSPDGRWLAYTSSTSGRDEIYVQAFPTPGPRVQLSAHGGRWARWRDDGRAVVFRAGREVLEVEVTPVDGRLEPSPARRWFELDDVDDPARRTFDLIDGGAGLVTVRRAPGWRPADALRVVVGWRPAP